MSPRAHWVIWLIAIATSACNVPLEHFDSPDAAAPGFGEQTYIKASNADAQDQFGLPVALSADGSTLAVGARGEASAVVGDPTNEDAPAAGAAYVFVRTGGSWMEQAYVKASSPGSDNLFGSAVALSADGSVLAVGTSRESGSALHTGAVYVFTRTGSTWHQDAYLKASNAVGGASFGISVALSSDGATLAVGARGDASGSTGPTDTSAPDAGAAYVFTHATTGWGQQAYVKPTTIGSGDFFGQSVSLSGDGATLAVGAIDEDSCSTDPADNSCTNAGAAYVFTRSGTMWTQQAYVKAPHPEPNATFGSTVHLSANGSILAVGALGESSAAGAVHLFTNTGATWGQIALVTASNAEANDNFSSSLALSTDGSILAVGAPGEASAATGIGGDPTNNGAPSSGAVYLFSRLGPSWNQNTYVKASNSRAGAGFASVALTADGATLAVGAAGESSGSRVINGIQADQSAANAGAVYIFH